MVVVSIKGESYYMNPRLKEKWDKIKDGKLHKKDEDRVYIVDGRERVGKSVFTLQQAAYIDPTIIDDYKERITFTSEETLEAIRKTKSDKTHTKAIIFDEAFRGLSSKSALSKTNKKLVQSMMEMGQNNIVLFIVSPSFFLLEMYPAVLRSNALFHIMKKKKGNARSFRAFNYQKKATLYRYGIKKGWGYNVRTKLKDNFSNKYPGGKEFEKKYRHIKSLSLREMGKDEKDKKEYLDRSEVIYKLHNEHKMSYQGIASISHLIGINLKKTQIGKLCREHSEKLGKSCENAVLL